MEPGNERVRGRQLSALKGYDPTMWLRVVGDSIREHGSVPATAEALEIGVRTLWRWISETPALRSIPISGRGRQWKGRA